MCTDLSLPKLFKGELFMRQCGPEAIQAAQGGGGWSSVPADLPCKQPLGNDLLPF